MPRLDGAPGELRTPAAASSSATAAIMSKQQVAADQAEHGGDVVRR